MYGLSHLAFALLALSHLTAADIVYFDANGTTYTEEALGPQPNQTFISRPDLDAPVLNLHNAPGSDVLNKTGLLFFNIASGPTPGLMIYTTDGHPVWINNKLGATDGISLMSLNLQIQEYQGDKYMAFFSGQYAIGDYYLYNNAYEEVKKISTVDIEAGGDPHEFSITKANTALFTLYPKVEFTRSSGDKIWLLDSCFQEIDIEKTELLFQWCASDHVSLEDSVAPPSKTGTGETPETASDWFHINSVDKDNEGNYLISSRHCSAIYHIDGSTGGLIWTMGGRSSDWTLPTDSVFHFQHMARWRSGGKQISLWDNGSADWPGSQEEEVGRGLLLNVNEESMAVSIAHQYISPLGNVSISQGSYQELANREVLTGTGAKPGYIGWYKEDGSLLYYAQLGIGPGAVSYRAFYFEGWTAEPKEDPAAVFQNNAVYVSWNGATEVKQWALRAKDGQGDDLVVAKTGFETEIANIEEDRAVDTKICALNESGKEIRCTSVKI